MCVMFVGGFCVLLSMYVYYDLFLFMVSSRVVRMFSSRGLLYVIFATCF